jgi:alkanesulfonate monooxygenase SsuD/methylene tetrahydromethanopterin reductase-like flavin-dependent oxidoreductase (luciferase family)
MRDAPLGLMNQLWALEGVDDRAVVRAAIAEAELADELGFDSLWIGEHHMSPGSGGFYGRIPAPEMLLAQIAMRTRRMRLGTGVKILSTVPPRRAAEEISLLDLLSGGRAEFGLGLGPTTPTSVQTRAEKIEGFGAALGEILSLLRGAPADGLAPLSPPADPQVLSRLWVAGRDPASIAQAAAEGLGLVVGQAELAERQAVHVRRYRQAGGRGTVRGVRLVFVAETEREAVARSESAARIYFGMMQGKGYHREAVEAGQLPAAADSLAEMRRQVSFFVGTPEQVAAGLAAYVAQTGVDRLDVMAQIPGLAAEDVRRSLVLLQQEVRPLLAGASIRPDADSGSD